MITKKKTIYTYLITLLTGFFLLAGCSVDSTGTVTTLDVQGTVPGTGATAGFIAPRALADATDIAVIAEDGITELGIITLTEAWISLGEINFQAEGVDSDLEIELEGPYIVDLLTNTVSPTLPDLDLTTGTYTEISMKIDHIDGTETETDGETLLVDENDPIYGYTVYLKGTYTGSAGGASYTDIPFVLSYDIEKSIELSGSSTSLGFTVDEGTFNPIIIAFRLNKWFNFNNSETNSDNFDFTDLIGITANPGIILDLNASGDNSSIREVIEKNITESADYGEDDNDDGDLDSDEDDDPDTEDDEDS
jgi:hypothetical protein